MTSCQNRRRAASHARSHLPFSTPVPARLHPGRLAAPASAPTLQPCRRSIPPGPPARPSRAQPATAPCIPPPPFSPPSPTPHPPRPPPAPPYLPSAPSPPPPL